MRLFIYEELKRVILSLFQHLIILKNK